MADRSTLQRVGLALLAALAAGAAAFYPTLVELVQVWNKESDYSHGFLVAPIAAYLLWSRRESLNSVVVEPSAWGFIALGVSLLLRVAGAHYYLDPVLHLALLVWVIGAVWTIAGGKALKWALPGILFLIFMFPIPFRYEQLFGEPLQRIATISSCWLLQSLGEAAFATGNVITIGEHKIEVVQACSGLRMLMGFVALCTAYAILCARPLWEKIMIVVASVPISILCNVLRITITGFLFQHASADLAHDFTHDAAGWLMMPMALGFLVVGLWYLDRLFVESEVADSTIRMRNMK